MNNRRQTKRSIPYLLVLLSVVAFFVRAAESEEEVTYIEALNTPITNPGTGIEAFHDGWGAVLTIAQYPASGMGYYRYYWTELEPNEGEYNFPLIDALLTEQTGIARKVALRFMALDEPSTGSKIPQWLIDKGISGQWVDSNKTFVPDLDDPTYLFYVERLLNAFGQRYDGHPQLAQMDIGMVGSWGEWHNSNFTELEPLLKKYPTQLLNKYVDMHFDAFPMTAKLMLLNGGKSLAYAVEKGAGWRADCWGDWHNFSTTWSHMRDDYPYRIKQAELETPLFSTAWQRAPVSFEVCGDMQGWLADQKYTRAQVKASLDWAISQHVSSLNLKSKPIPEQYRDLLDDALLKIGYRFRVDTFRHPSRLEAGHEFTFETQFINEGVTPTYQAYYAYFRLVNSDNDVVFLGRDDTSTQTWLPGSYQSSLTAVLPEGLTQGRYYIEVAVSESRESAPLNLANKGKQADGWYRLSDVVVIE
ncbi:DUF4832 domain-containing protein [Vibrio cionasavignyae]|uniref:DUF4832 domain-containing protein n=1 Tax=Vibrio cionasavignyae TaxID=2910252 RepID=UPI003D14DE5C